MDDVPEISVSSAPCGSPSNPHRVRSATSLTCLRCGGELGSAMTERLIKSLRPEP